MPIDYKRYPPEWKEIRARILQRANNVCEHCGINNNEIVWATKHKGKSHWHKTKNEADDAPKTIERGKLGIVANPKAVRVVLTIAHLDHDETNHSVKDDRLVALCQLCHLRYDAKEKYRRKTTA